MSWTLHIQVRSQVRWEYPILEQRIYMLRFLLSKRAERCTVGDSVLKVLKSVSFHDYRPRLPIMCVYVYTCVQDTVYSTFCQVPHKMNFWVRDSRVDMERHLLD